MQKELKCKFCGALRMVTFDDEYYKLKDPFGLEQLFCCTRCAEFRVERRRIFGHIKRLAEQLICNAYKSSKANNEPIKEALRDVLKRYMRLLASHRMVSTPDWDESIVEAIMDCPRQFADVLRKIGTLPSRQQGELI